MAICTNPNHDHSTNTGVCPTCGNTYKQTEAAATPTRTINKTVTIGQRTEEGRKRPLTISAEIEYKDGRLSVCGQETPGGSSGQIDMHYTPELIAEIQPAEGMTPESIARLFEVWGKWHLNHMQAGCEHQRASWDLDAKIKTEKLTISWDTFRALEKAAGKTFTEARESGGMSAGEKSAALLYLLETAQIKPFKSSIVKDEALLRRLAAGFTIINATDVARLKKYAEDVTAFKLGERMIPRAGGNKPLLTRTVETKAACNVPQSEHPEGMLSRPCEVCGYAYGSKWLREEVPANVLEFLEALPDGAEPQPAEDFLKRNDLELDVVLVGDQCPPWSKTKGKDCDHVHGLKYKITISNGAESVNFPFWNSLNDKQEKKTPSAYDVLACISNDVNTPSSFEEFCSEYGYDQDSREAERTFKRADELAAKLREFFTPEQVEELSEIR